MKLRTSILSLVLAVVVPLATVSILLVYTLFQHGQEAARRAATDRVRAVMTAIDAKLLGAIGTVEALAVSPALRSGDLDAFYRQASEIVRAQPDWSAITLSTPSGEQLVNTLRPLGYKLPPVPHHDGMIEPVKAPKAVVGDVIKVPLLNDYVVPIRVPVVLPDGVPYMVRAGIRLSAFQRIIEAQHLQADEVIGLVDSTGRFVARVPPQPPTAMASPAFLEHARANESGWYRGLTVEGEDTFTAYTRSAQSGWMLGHALPLSSVYQPGVRAGAILAGGVVIALVIALLLAFWIARRIIEPVQALGRAAQALGRNDAPTPAAEGARPRAASPLLAASGRIDELREVERLLSQASAAVHERQELLAREARALQASDKAKTEFLAMLSHELRNPLAALVSASALLRRVAIRDSTFEFARDVIERQTAQMRRLIDDLLDISSLAVGKATLRPEPVDLGELVPRLAATWQASERMKGRRLLVEAESLWASADAARLEQVLFNLLDNAVKFSPDGSPIELRVRADGPWVAISVRDYGDGFMEHDRDELFGLFVQGRQDVSRRHGGLGVGLALARRLAELHGGSVDAASDGPGKGALFTIRLPRIEHPARAEPRVSLS
jgi:signal transduction histidine kinase